MAVTNKPTAKTPAKPALPAKRPTAEPASSSKALTIAPPRLPYHIGIQQRFGIDQTAWRALVEAIFPAAKTTGSVIMALSYCKARRLDPFKRPVNIVPVWDAKTDGYVETVWPSIGEHRITAHRTGVYAGMDPMVWGPMEARDFTGRVKRDGAYKDVTISLEFPSHVQATVYRMIGGQRVPFTAQVFWLETYGKQGGTDLPNRMWEQRPHGQLAKCAEAQALRMAFPEEIGSDPTAEEMEGQTMSHAPAPAALTADDVPSAPQGTAGVIIDAETGEVSDDRAPPAEPSLMDRFRAAVSASGDAEALDHVWNEFEPAMPQDSAEFEAYQAVYEARSRELGIE